VGFDYPSAGATARVWVVGVTQGAFFALVAVTVVRRRSAWRAWAVFAAGFVSFDLLAAVGRASLSEGYAVNTVYWTFFAYFLAMTLALALFPAPLPGGASSPAVGALRTPGVSVATSPPRPILGTQARHARSRRPDVAPRWQLLTVSAVALALCTLGARAIWTGTVHGYGAYNRQYAAALATSWDRIHKQEADAFVWDTVAPAEVLSPVFAPFNRVSGTVAMMVPGLRFDAASGPGYAPDPSGWLLPMTRRIKANVVAPTEGACYGPWHSAEAVGLNFDRSVPAGQYFLRLDFRASTGVALEVNDDTFELHKGRGSLMMPFALTAPASAAGMVIPPARTFCLTGGAVQQPVPTG
jgi:hypothetical protein